METWKVGNHNSCVVVDQVEATRNYPYIKSFYDYYGGFLVCESVSSERDMRKIVAAPEMFELLRSIENDNGSIPEELWNKIQDVVKRVEP